MPQDLIKLQGALIGAGGEPDAGLNPLRTVGMVPLSLTLEGSPGRVNSGVSRPGQRPTAPEGGRFCAVSLPPDPQEGPCHKAHRTAVGCAHPRSGTGLSLP